MSDKKPVLKKVRTPKSKEVLEPDKKINGNTARSKYFTVILPKWDWIRMCLRDGMTEADIIKRLSINESTWYGYKSKYTEFGEMLNESRQDTLAKVEHTMLQMALGMAEDVQEFWKREFNPITKRYELVLTEKRITRKPSIVAASKIQGYLSEGKWREPADTLELITTISEENKQSLLTMMRVAAKEMKFDDDEDTPPPLSEE